MGIPGFTTPGTDSVEMRKGCGSAGFSKGDTVGPAVVLSGLSEIIIELSEKRALPGTFLPQMLQSGPGSR